MTRTYFFTFGYGHRHPETGHGLENHYVRVEVPPSEDDYWAARALMVSRFGKKWAFQYEDPEEAGVERFGLKLLDVLGGD